MVKEIIYIHASTGYLATHFFNTQQAYFTQDKDTVKGKEKQKEANDEVDPDISFREGLTPTGTTTYTPRAIMIDYKSKFGSISDINAFQSTEDAIPEASDPIWAGSVSEYRQNPIPQSSYHARLDAGEDETNEDEDMIYEKEDLSSSVRFWSDFSRVFFHPRGLLRIPDLPEWERETTWMRGAERFTDFDSEAMILDDVFRLFAEECDLLQGLQLSLNAPSFGSFTIKLLTQIRDEYPKLLILSFCSLSPFQPSTVSLDDAGPCMGALNDALTLHELAGLSSVTVPLQHPSTWKRGAWSDHLNIDFSNQYHSSALLSAHIESATLPLRLKQSVSFSTDIANLCSHLNWRSDTPFSALSGAFPMPGQPQQLPRYTFDFSHPAIQKNGAEEPFAQRDVFRGLNTSEQASVDKWFTEAHQELQPPFHSLSFIDEPYPIPSSYPQFFKNVDPKGRPLSVLSKAEYPPRIHSVPIYSSLRTTPRTAGLAKSYARLSENISRRSAVVIDSLGVEKEFVREVGENWWRWVGAYGGDEGEDEERGEDE